MQYRDLAIEHSANCFLNSLARDFNFKVTRDYLFLDEIKVPVKHYSHVGAHRFDSKNFTEVLKKICGETKLQERVINSIHNMSLFLEQAGARFIEKDLSFLKGEQDLLIGHNFHPCPKSRDEFGDQDLLNYAPELSGNFSLCWFLVKKELIYFEKSKDFSDEDWMIEIFKNKIPTDFVPYPVHPWQYEKLLLDKEIQNYIAKKEILPCEGPAERWYATSSMRTLYQPNYKYMLKFSMSVKMTNSIRHLQLNEVSRGMKLKDTFETKRLQKFVNDFSHFKMMHEPYFCAIKDSQGIPLPQTIVLLRENLIIDEDCIMLATLNQNNPYLRENILSAVIRDSRLSPEEWFNEFIEKSILPFLYLQADYGIYLGAHQQNLIVRLENFIPIGSYFRDCQGTSQGEVPKDAATHLFTYYLVINSVFSSIAAISASTQKEESIFIRIFNNNLLKLKSIVKDSSVIDHLLFSKELTQKGNFRCNLSNINENTTNNPLSIYNSFPNPLVNL